MCLMFFIYYFSDITILFNGIKWLIQRAKKCCSNLKKAIHRKVKEVFHMIPLVFFMIKTKYGHPLQKQTTVFMIL